MGYFIDSRGIKCFSPDNSPTRYYISVYGGMRMADMLAQAAQHFNTTVADIIGARTSQHSYSIDCDYIQTHAIGYDQYDSTDYTMYLLIEKHTNRSSNGVMPSQSPSPGLPSQSQSPSQSLSPSQSMSPSPSPSPEIEVEPQQVQVMGFNVIKDQEDQPF